MRSAAAAAAAVLYGQATWKGSLHSAARQAGWSSFPVRSRPPASRRQRQDHLWRAAALAPSDAAGPGRGRRRRRQLMPMQAVAPADRTRWGTIRHIAAWVGFVLQCWQVFGSGTGRPHGGWPPAAPDGHAGEEAAQGQTVVAMMALQQSTAPQHSETPSQNPRREAHSGRRRARTSNNPRATPLSTNRTG